MPMKSKTSDEGKQIVTGWDIGGAHLKMAQAVDAKITAARTVKAAMWLGLDEVRQALATLRAEFSFSATNVFTMTGELSDGFVNRDDGIRNLLDFIESEFGAQNTLIYAGRSGFADIAKARTLGPDIASANWHATAALAAHIHGEGLFVDMGSTTTDILALRDGVVKNTGYTDAERLMSGELVYTGFTRSALIGIAAQVPVRGAMTPLMNEYFANTADLGRILGTLDEADDQFPAADRRDKNRAASIGRLARMLGRDSADLEQAEWVTIAKWFAEHQLRMIHDGAFRVAAFGLADKAAPVIGAGIGRPQIERLAARLDRPYIDFGSLIPATDDSRDAASKAAPAAAVALLASSPSSGSASP